MGTGTRGHGLYGKFNVSRVDGRDAPGGVKAKADYFVLDIEHDPFARQALAVYAHACSTEYPVLAADLQTKLALWTAQHGNFEVPGFREVAPGRFQPR